MNTLVMDSDKGNPHQKIGEVLTSFNHLESVISHTLSTHLGISDEGKIKILFNSSIIHFGAKLKLLANFKLYDNGIIGKLRELSCIRNGFAHAYLSAQEARYGYKDGIVVEVEVMRTIEVMNSQGIIEPKDLDDMYVRYSGLHDEFVTFFGNTGIAISPYLGLPDTSEAAKP